MGTVIDLNLAKTQAELRALESAPTYSIDAATIRDRLNASAPEFVQWLFAGRAFIAKREARIGDVMGNPGGSLSIALAGKDVGQWYDHSTGQKGDLIGLFEEHIGCDFQTALREIAGGFFNEPVPHRDQLKAAERILQKKEKLGDKPRADMVELGAPVATYKFLDLHGNIIASEVRFEPDGTRESKTFRPFCFKIEEGERRWRPGMPDVRPLFRLPQIATAQTVVFVEGAGKAEALAAMGIEATSAFGGSNTLLEKIDWSPLYGKRVVLWSDNDAVGRAYMHRVGEHLAKFRCEIASVRIPDGKPETWDAKDCIEEDGNPQALIEAALGSCAQASTAGPPFFQDIDDLDDDPPPKPLIQGIITEGGLSMLFGKSGSFKSFVAADMALCVATGLEWFGHPVKRGLVIYVSGEGQSGFKERLRGWRQSARGQGAPHRPKFKLVTQPLAFDGREDLNLFVGNLLQLIDQIGERPALIVIDTVNRTMLGDENKTEDMTKYRGALDQIRHATGAHVMVVHHSGLADDKRERGSTVMRASADTVILCERKGPNKLRLINGPPQGKQKDFEEFADIALATVRIEFTARDGSKRYTLILEPDTGSVSPVGSAAGQGGQSAPPARKTGSLAMEVLNFLTVAGPSSRAKIIAGCPSMTPDKFTNTMKGLVAGGSGPVETYSNGTNSMWRIATP